MIFIEFNLITRFNCSIFKKLASNYYKYIFKDLIIIIKQGIIC